MTDETALVGEIVNEPAERHHLDELRTRRGVLLTCRCGEWEAWASGPISLGRCRIEHRVHAGTGRLPGTP